MRALTPVTKAAIVIDSGSISSPTLTCRRSTENQVNQVSTTRRGTGAMLNSAGEHEDA